MSRTPSVETQLRRMKRELARYEAELSHTNRLRYDLKKKTAECEQWQARFDALLKIVPPREGR